MFVAGASGAVGRRLCRLLVQDGWHVTGTTRVPERAIELKALGVTPVMVDAFDETALRAAVAGSRARVVIHQLTDLQTHPDPAQSGNPLVRNARIREVGTRHLVAAAVACGAERFIAQSIAFVYAPGLLPHHEEGPLDIDAQGTRGVTARGAASLEQQVLCAPLTGIVLRYGRFYGPATGADAPSRTPAVHVDAAADAARRAVTRGQRGIYNVAESGGTVAIERAQTELGWDAGFRIQDVPA